MKIKAMLLGQSSVFITLLNLIDNTASWIITMQTTNYILWQYFGIEDEQESKFIVKYYEVV